MPDPKVETLLSEISKWTEDRFFALEPATERRYEMELSRSQEAGYWIAAPGALQAARRDNLPLILLTHFSAMREWEVSEEANAILAVSVLGGSPLEPCFAFPSNKRWQPGEWGSRHGPTPGPEMQKIFTSQVRTLNARTLCKIPWNASRVALTYIVYDWRSNTIITELKGEPAPSTPIATESAAPFRRSLFAAKFEMGKLPFYGPSTYHLPVSGEGIALRIPSKTAQGASIPALGTVRVPIPEPSLLRAGDADLPAALLKAELLLLQLDNPHRGIVPVTIPVYSEPGKDLRAGEVAEAHFAVDLHPQIQPGLEPGEYLVYMVLQEHIAGPVKFVVE